MYVTKCSDCGGDLRVVAYTRSDTGDRVHDNTALSPDGFCPDIALTTLKGFDTEDEVVECADCGKTGPLEHV
ncbi:MAG: hypothetical protein JSS66_05690 [Armatimonadetes bacterium]|nr:hypothetical protein [Armatimonadota bacterium]